MRDFYVSWKSC